MAITRKIVGWDGPFLPSLAAFLCETYRDGSEWNMERVVVALPGMQAGRRLTELLAERASSTGGGSPVELALPEIITTGELPEILYEQEGDMRAATPIERHLGLIATLQANPDALLRLTAALPERDDLLEWSRLADQLEAIEDELEAGRLECADAADSCRGALGFDDDARWGAIARIGQAYRKMLAGQRLTTIHAARQSALQRGLRSDREVVLGAVIDMPKMTAEMLRSSGAPVTVVIWAPDTYCDYFDDLGSIVTAKWQDASIELNKGSVLMADRPLDQAESVIAKLRQASPIAPGDVTVAVADESLGMVVERLLEMTGVPARSAQGRDASASAPALLLSAAADCLDDFSAPSLAALVRHPAMRSVIDGVGGSQDGWIAAIDRFMPECLPATLDRDWAAVAAAAREDAENDGLSSGDRAASRALARQADAIGSAKTIVTGLISALRGPRRPLSEWGEPIANFLADIYGARQLEGDNAEDVRLADQLRKIAGHLVTADAIPSLSPLAVPATASNAIRLTLSMLAGDAIPEDVKQSAVTIAGWLEAPLDDAPMIIVAGVNERFLPASVASDAFLPNRLRTALGLVDSAQRYARDAYLLTAMAASRAGNLTLICGRRSAEGDPLTPSRLIFACNRDEMVERALSFYDEHGAEARTPVTGLRYSQTDNLAVIPRPPAGARLRSDRLAVTALREYLRCPYRFYLRYVLRLESIEEAGDELNEARFGTLAHYALAQFGRSSLRESTDGEAITRFLHDCLDNEAARRFGDVRLPAVEIQIAQLKNRLSWFSMEQAKWAAEGWEIVEIEKEHARLFEYGSGALTVAGKLDRLDRMRGTDRYCVIDYKCGDAGKTPEDTHRTGRQDDRKWVDLQLPVYRQFVADSLPPDASIDLAYFTIGDNPQKCRVAVADWTIDDLSKAAVITQEVVGGIGRGRFWPPSPDVNTRFDDGFRNICLDLSPSRRNVIERPSGFCSIWPEYMKPAEV